MILITKTDGIKQYTKDEGQKILKEDVQRILNDQETIVMGKCADDSPKDIIDLFHKKHKCYSKNQLPSFCKGCTI